MMKTYWIISTSSALFVLERYVFSLTGSVGQVKKLALTCRLMQPTRAAVSVRLFLHFSLAFLVKHERKCIRWNCSHHIWLLSLFPLCTGKNTILCCRAECPKSIYPTAFLSSCSVIAVRLQSTNHANLQLYNCFVAFLCCKLSYKCIRTPPRACQENSVQHGERTPSPSAVPCRC